MRKCPYCDFNSHALRGELPATAYVDALLADVLREIKHIHEREISSVFFGGGTPSLFPPAALARLLEGLQRYLRIAADCEITLEANPGSVDQARFEDFRSAGVNRLSIGVQSFQADSLHRLGRIHGPQAAVAAVETAHAAGFDNFNIDLMYGLPNQGRPAAVADITQAIALAPPHISHYQLTLEPNTAFAARPPALPEDDAIYAMQIDCQTRLAGAGYQHYEVSAYALRDRRCRHNLNYWSFGDYLGIGAGAHGKVTDLDKGKITRYEKLARPMAYIREATAGEAVAKSHQLSAQDAVLEFMMNALRLPEGVPRKLCTARTGLPWVCFEAAVDDARNRGWLDITADDRVRPTALGMRFLNNLLGCFLPPD
ncbi:coproporphyrinogen III oxidase [Nitrococcus mobilis Nb-231]|uniref:Heme chaperone HemW n=1 Tax=Nitrococcus mobilis Nb-231 TaxID=314278 RepID=A4BQT8_9GAMM|nr:coproporphyrinogen III oxidase [Nitrococcus mobilis Nb-231]